MNSNSNISPPNGAENGSNNAIKSNNSRTPESSSIRTSIHRSSARVLHTRIFTDSVAGMNGHVFQVHNEQSSGDKNYPIIHDFRKLSTAFYQCRELRKKTQMTSSLHISVCYALSAS